MIKTSHIYHHVMILKIFLILELFPSVFSILLYCELFLLNIMVCKFMAVFYQYCISFTQAAVVPGGWALLESLSKLQSCPQDDSRFRQKQALKDAKTDKHKIYYSLILSLIPYYSL